VQTHGTLAGLVELGHLDREDMETAEGVFVEALPAVPMASHDWDDDGDRWEVGPALNPIRGGAPEPYEPTEQDWAE
jgi:hypothetical protein